MPVPVVSHPSELTLTGDDVVLLCVKGQDTPTALEGLAGGPADLAIACLQNGVDNERQVLRRTPNTYAVPVMLPGTYLEPGVVEASSAPITGILDVGRYPSASTSGPRRSPPPSPHRRSARSPSPRSCASSGRSC